MSLALLTHRLADLPRFCVIADHRGRRGSNLTITECPAAPLLQPCAAGPGTLPLEPHKLSAAVVVLLGEEVHDVSLTQPPATSMVLMIVLTLVPEHTPSNAHTRERAASSCSLRNASRCETSHPSV